MDPKDEIKDKTDIVALVSEYLELKPSGMNSFRALCPFHSEKSPSFHVSSDRQIFHCFGCGEGGDIFTFIQKMEGMDFPETLLHLGKKCGVEVKRFSTTEGNTKQRLFQIHDLTVSFYKKVLSDSSIAHTARDYLANRGITIELIEQFGLGFAPDDWSWLSDVLLKRGFSEAELIQAGLSLRKKSGVGLIDRFRARVMIPLRDQHGNTVGFTGRVLPLTTSHSPLPDAPKYMNSPETPIYHKGRLLYGLDLAKRAIKDQKAIIVVEGNLDVVASHKAHVQNVVGSSGTAFTADQLELLKRYTQTVIFCFDRDAAGLTAAKKSVTIARSLGFDVRAITLPPDVKDPDELVQKNPEVWQKLAISSIPFMQFLFDRTFVNRDVSNVDDKRSISHELLPAISEIMDVVEREHWLTKLSALLAIDASMLREAIRPTTMGKKTVNAPRVQQDKLSKKDQLICVLLGTALNDVTSFDRVVSVMETIVIEHSSLTSLYNFMRSQYTLFNATAKQKSFFSHVRDGLEQDPLQRDLIPLLDQSSVFAEQAFESIAPNAVQSQLNQIIEVLHATDRQMRRSVIAQKLRQAEDTGDSEKITQLMYELNKIS